MWWADPAWASPALLDLLDERERERHARFRFEADRNRYAVAHALARLVCAREAGCAPDEVAFSLHCRGCARKPGGRSEPHGKPRPDGPAHGLEISLSHSGDRVALALTRGVAVGTDVERVSAERDIEGIIEYALTGAERAALESLPPEAHVNGFFGYWARKEALLKATGDGLSAGLSSISVNGPHEPAELHAWNAPEPPEHAWLTDLDAGPDYRAALAVLAPGPLTVVPRDAAPLLLGR
nr:4'-phosphopantetheinyl transferase superfamily protein [Allosalinactinospora lopnorensis]